jgi:hypothetical protein
MMGIKKDILENKEHLIPISTHYYIANLPICNEVEFASFHNLKNLSITANSLLLLCMSSRSNKFTEIATQSSLDNETCSRPKYKV